MKGVHEDSGVEPDELKNMPLIDEDIVTPYEAFRRLSKSRQYSDSGPQSIVFSEILKYVKEILLAGPDQVLFYVDLIQAADEEYVNYKREQIVKKLQSK